MTRLETLQRRAAIAPHGLKRQREQELRNAVHEHLARMFERHVDRAARLAVEGV